VNIDFQQSYDFPIYPTRCRLSARPTRMS